MSSSASNKVLKQVTELVSSNWEEYGNFSSSHEIYGVLAEELQEFFDDVRAHKKDGAFDPKELIDIAAVAIHAAIQIEKYGEIGK